MLFLVVIYALYGQNISIRIVSSLSTTPNNLREIAEISKEIIKKTYKHGLPYKQNFKYPLEIDMIKLSRDISSNITRDEVTIINPHPFSYTILPKHKCNFIVRANWTIIIIVKSDIRNVDRRQVIRNTWGNTGNSSDVSVVFMLGVGDVPLSAEETKYNDIIQENFIDTYRNNTIKTIMGFNWAVKYCPTANFLFLVDDDYFVNVANLMTLPQRCKNKQNVYLGSITSKAIPYRDQDSKWYTTWEEYPYDKWPPYIMGGAYLVSMKTARQFQMIFPYVKPIHMDDVFLGIVSHKLNIRPIGAPLFYDGKKKGHRIAGGSVASHGYENSVDVYRAWKQLPKKYGFKKFTNLTEIMKPNA
ncbi:BRN [Mytilus coruscus]|uniref:Hexosyltransferase n=1 Tax=Mytilus coruscus TaxID=42192 RepID=A0A6J8AH48_MYTCO|nr:BRN [Mytilus coruscus]